MVIDEQRRTSTGIPGFDEVLDGGLIAARTYLISGPPGTGKTTLGWHFLCDGARNGETVLYISFAESEAELRANAALSGFDAAGVHVVDLSPSPELFARAETYDIFSASEVEREPTTARIVEAVERLHPQRVFVDSMTHLRFLASDGFHFRRQALSFLRYLADRGAAVVVTSESTPETPDDDLRFIADGVIELGLDGRGRTLSITKFRGSGFRIGKHTLVLGPGGATVFPRLIPSQHVREFVTEKLSSGLPHLDELLHGGLERGSVTLISGPTGVGKTTLGVQFMKEAARSGLRSVVYTFDEPAETILLRCESIGMGVRAMLEHRELEVIELEAMRYGPDEFANFVRRDVEEKGTRIVMIDSVSGYRLSVTGGDLSERLHALGRYLQNVGVTLLLIDELRELTSFRATEVGISYLADNLLFLRYVERVIDGTSQLRKAIGVLKKRMSDFEKTVRAFEITGTGVRIGGVLQISSVFASLPQEGHADSHS
jgi:circadian clock protein KaiC